MIRSFTRSRAGKKILKGDLRNDLELYLQSVEKGEPSIVLTVPLLQNLLVDGYTYQALPVFVPGLGVLQWNPNSVLLHNGSTVIRPSVGAAATGPGRWLQVTPNAQVIGPGFPGTWGFALADHVHPMGFIGAPVLIQTALNILADNEDQTIEVTGNATPVTVLLPLAPRVNQHIGVVDGDGQASTYAITVDGNGKFINGSGTPILITIDYTSLSLLYEGSKWVIL